MTKGDLVYRRNMKTSDLGIVVNLRAGDGSFSTWVDVMWKDGGIHTHEPRELIKVEDDTHRKS
jgi:hypothetical protein